MKRKSIFGIAAVVLAAAGAAVAAKFIKDKVDEPKEIDDDVNFINIDEEEGGEEEGEEGSDDEEGELESEDTDESTDVVSEICELYPYLDSKFVIDCLENSGVYNDMFDDNTLVTIKHEVSFRDHEDLNEFLDIMESAGYTCVQIEENEVSAVKKVMSENGAIVSEILNVANQVGALNGTYIGQEMEG